MDTRASLSILLLLFGIAQASPLMVRSFLVSLSLTINSPQMICFKHLCFYHQEQMSDDVFVSEPEPVDITTRILETNNGEASCR